jgi:uncharacterized protein YlxW (UPF0749 family)
MEKRIKYQQFQQVKSAAKMIDPLKNKIVPLKKKVEELVAQVKSYQTQIDALESGIVTVIGFNVDDLVRKVIEPTGKTDANGRPIKITKYIPTDIVAYDEQHKEFVVTIPDENEQPAEQTETPEVPTEVELETSEVNDASFLDA